jgi:hypothetical protein
LEPGANSFTEGQARRLTEEVEAPVSESAQPIIIIEKKK